MRKVLVIDIETMARDAKEALQPFMSQIKGKGPTETWENQNKAIEKAALSPVCARVISIAVAEVNLLNRGESEDYLADTEAVAFFCHESEYEMLTQFISYLAGFKNPILVTFNGRGFDFPFLMFRCGVHGIPFEAPIYPYNGRDDHIDLMLHLNQVAGLDKLYYKLEYIGLKRWIEYFAIPVKKLSIADGEIDLPTLFASGKYDEIRAYNMGDVMATLHLLRTFQYNFESIFYRHEGY
jgi:hypothetical protein